MLTVKLSTLHKYTSCQLRLKENSRKETLWSRDLRRNATVDPDQSQEQLNRIGKRGGGIVGITQMPIGLGRWALSHNLRSHIAAETKELYYLGYADDINYNKGSASRQKKDTAHKDALHFTAVFKGLLYSHQVPMKHYKTLSQRPCDTSD